MAEIAPDAGREKGWEPRVTGKALGAEHQRSRRRVRSSRTASAVRARRRYLKPRRPGTGKGKLNQATTSSPFSDFSQDFAVQIFFWRLTI
jgi:hypothetical protein